MFPNATQFWRWTLNILGFLATANWMVLSAPFRALAGEGRAVAADWRKIMSPITPLPIVVREVLYLVGALYWLLRIALHLCLWPFRLLALAWRCLIATMDWCWDTGAFLIQGFLFLAWKWLVSPILRFIWSWLLAPSCRPNAHAFMTYVWHGALAAAGVWLWGWFLWLTGFITRPLARFWRGTAPLRAWVADTKIGRPVVDFAVTARRIFNVLRPYWLAHGWWSALGLAAVGVITYKVYFWLRDLTGQMDFVTQYVIDAIKLGPWDFAQAYVLPIVVGVGLVIYVAKKLWPKNPNADGFLLLLGLLMLMLSVNTLNVILNFANGAITDAMDVKDQAMFNIMVIRLLLCFVIGTFVVVLYSFVRNRLALSWRQWYTYYIMDRYMANRNYYRVNYDPTIDNPDERIQQDIDGMVAGALSLLLTFLGGIITYFTFVGILKQVDPTGYLPIIAYVWSAVFTVVAVFVGARLVGLNFDKAAKEADLRYNLIHIRKNVESIAFYHSEEKESGALRMRFKEVLTTWSSLIGWTRNLGFIQTGADYFTVAIPFLILGPLVFSGEIPMGTVGRAAMAFGQVLSALTMVISEFGSISLFLSRIKRLATLTEKLPETEPTAEPGTTVIEHQQGEKMSYNNVTLLTPNRQRTLVADLTMAVESYSPVVIMGPSGSGKSSMLRALADLPLWDNGSGLITRPDLSRVMFLPQVPYMLLGNFRDQLLYRSGAAVTDAELEAVLKLVNLPEKLEQVGGWDAVMHWSDVLSPGEQQRLALARLLVAKPEYAILDEATSALDEVNEENVYALLHKSGITYASVGHRPSLLKYHRRVLRLTGDGGWTLKDSPEYLEK
jgi:putative ATP-binding cassette transporter